MKAGYHRILPVVAKRLAPEQRTYSGCAWAEVGM